MQVLLTPYIFEIFLTPIMERCQTFSDQGDHCNLNGCLFGFEAHLSRLECVFLQGGPFAEINFGYESPAPAAKVIRAPVLISSPNAVRFVTPIVALTIPRKTLPVDKPAPTGIQGPSWFWHPIAVNSI